ncbi:unnamed protein product [Oncorhynchus mykiss]|uniref:Uncharacterized protein n=1 Tax=Oncorhynchus mykiss TaxID=8022 RepID=A0A060WFL8_ONCMY|nr:unnamed protein product [Oncorhynchus mykiss]
MTTAESERNLSTLKRIKIFTRNSMGQKMLNALAMLSIHHDFIQRMPDFDDKVIEKFNHKKDHRANFLFK